MTARVSASKVRAKQQKFLERIADACQLLETLSSEPRLKTKFKGALSTLRKFEREVGTPIRSVQSGL
jgi:hypothetical protein